MSQQHQVAGNAQQELAIKPSLNTLAQGSMFWQPDFRRASPWLEHSPFLFWLVEALRPRQCVGLGIDAMSHFTLCQAVSRLRLDSHCFLVGDSTGNPAAGELLNEHGAEFYPTISQWLDTNPTRAIQQFDEGTVDLLVLNVTPQDDSVDYLLDRWLSRLSPQGVVLLPGIARREPGCQVFRAFEALQAQYPHFAFHHGNGLGVIAVGKQQTTLLHNLLASLESAASSRVVQDIFARLGRSCRDKLSAQEQRALVQQLEEQVAGQAAKLEASDQQNTALNEQLTTSKDESTKLKKRLETQEERFAHERGRLAERVSSLEEFNQELKQELMRQRNQNERREEERREQAAALKSAEQALQSSLAEIAEMNQQIKANEEQLSAKDQKLKASDEQLKANAQQIKTNEEQLAAKDQKLKASDEQLKAKEQKIKALQQESETRFEELAKLTTLLETSEQALATERQETTRLAGQVEQLTDDLKRPSEEAASLKKQLAQQRQEAKVFADERFRELAILTELLEKKDTDTQQEIDRQARELAALAALLDQRGIDYSSVLSTGNESSDAVLPSTPITPQPPVSKAPPLTKRSIKRQISLIEASRFFDAKWYLAQYPDVARDPKMSANPARHYLLMGGFEGRNPGPEFDSAFYLATHRDVVESGINPLVHYLKFGEKEQRAIKA